ncbi:MAG TPA: DUF2240 family protein [Candidatus Thermoplasmatota archaeon]|nr:DUF2240 family protein [Candidatus Thermoplasmatota archaeon]
MERIRQAVAFLFRRASESEIRAEDLARQASLDLHWFSPKDARRFLEVAQALGHLKAGEKLGGLAPTFDPFAVELPLDFRIDAAALPTPPAAVEAASGVTGKLVEAAAAASGASPAAVFEQVRRKAEDKLLELPVAAALVAREAGVDLAPYFGRIRDELRRAAAATPSSSG